MALYKEDKLMYQGKFSLKDLEGISVAVSGLSDSVKQLYDIFKIISKTSIEAVRATSKLVRAEVDSALAAIKLFLTKLSKELDRLAKLSAEYDVLLIPPMSTGAVYTFVDKKIEKAYTKKDIAHAGMLFWAGSSDINKTIKAFQGIATLFAKKEEPLFPLQTHIPRIKTRLVEETPRILWEYPSNLLMSLGKLQVLDGAKKVYATIGSVERVRIYRRDADKTEKLLLNQEAGFMFRNWDDKSKPKLPCEYRVAFDYKLSNGQIVENVKSSWSTVKKGEKKNGFSFASDKLVLADIQEFTGRISSVVDGLIGLTETVQKDFETLLNTLEKQLKYIEARINKILSAVKRLSDTIKNLTESAIGFAAFIDNAQKQFRKVEFTQSELTTGVLILGKSESIDALIKITGIIFS